MKAGFWVAPEGGEQAMNILPIGGETIDEFRPPRNFLFWRPARPKT